MRRSLRLVSLLALPAAALAAGYWLRPAPAPVAPLPAAPFIDMHCHVAGIGAGGSGCFVSAALRRSWKFDIYLHAFGTTQRELRQRGDAVLIARIASQVAQSPHLQKAVILALDGVVDAEGNLDRARTEIYVPNEYVAAQVARYPNLLFGASVNPYRRDALARLEWAKAHGAVLVKWLPSVQHIDPADPALIPFYRGLAELRLPLLVHTGSEHSFTRAEDILCDPARLRLALEQGVTVIAAHAATTGRYDGEPAFARLTRLMREYPNLYADISSLTQINKHGDLRQVLACPDCAGRLVYGTDYPLVAIRSLVSPWYYFLRLRWADCWRIARISNPWERDIALKQLLGVPTDVWTRAGRLLGVE